MATLRKPTKADLLASAGKTLPDLIAPNLHVLSLINRSASTTI
ncbi:MAG: hypothetical protein ACYDBJ_25450 [Aggregatilineales bacterium]